jgi:hypothetical protein
MTEAEWMICRDPGPMLELIQTAVSVRKLRLFAAACCRRVLEHAWTEWSRPAVGAAEQFADELVALDQLAHFRAAIAGGLELYGDEPIYDAPYYACEADIRMWVEACAFYAANNSTRPFTSPGADHQAERIRRDEVVSQTELLRDIFGNPFQFPALNPRWQTADVVGLARAIYDDRTFDRLPILADALIDAGCDDENVLAHCRSDGPHVRGCWVVDLVLGKE